MKSDQLNMFHVASPEYIKRLVGDLKQYTYPERVASLVYCLSGTDVTKGDQDDRDKYQRPGSDDSGIYRR